MELLSNILLYKNFKRRIMKIKMNAAITIRNNKNHTRKRCDFYQKKMKYFFK